MTEKIVLLKVLAGSRGYGVYDEDSDYDYRGVYVEPTSTIISIGYRYKGTDWIEDKKGGQDNTAYEIGHFLNLALKCNPTILNTLKAPVVKESSLFGPELRQLFPAFLDSKRCYDAFTGYGFNQRKKMIENKDDRWRKYGAAYVRQVLYLKDLLFEGDYEFKLSGIAAQYIRNIRNGEWTPGEILDYCEDMISFIKDYKSNWIEFSQDVDAVNEFLLRVRKFYW